jgi:hypothetical protein
MQELKMKKCRHAFVAAAILACVGVPAAFGAVSKNAAAAQEQLRAQFPGVQTLTDQGRTRIVYGTRMTTDRSPRLAAERWLRDHGHAFGAGRLDLDEQTDTEVSFGRFHVFHYTQAIDGLPVDSSPGRVLARNNGDGTWSVVYAAGLFVAPPEGGFAPMALTGRGAVDFVRGSEFGRLPVWSEPELVVYQQPVETGYEARRAWSFVGENPDLLRREKFTFFVDAATGAMLEARNEVHHADVFGFVRGNATPGVLPDLNTNQPVLFPVNDVRVAISGGNNAFTDTDGFFNIAHGGNNNVTITSSLTNGRWSRIVDQSGTAVQSVSGTATPGQEAYLEYNSTPSEFRTAQVNAFIHTGLIHNFITDRSSWTGMNFVCTTNVNINSSCNAFFDGSSINFYRAAGSCVNTAYSTVVAHEYGHYVVNRLGLSQGAFGEGFGDTCAHMLYDTGIVGEHFFTNGGNIRDNENTNRTYPCSGGVHFCGQLLAGTWWDVRLNFADTYGSEAGLTEAQQLFVDWMLITTGGQGDNSAWEGTAIEVLTVDDDDGNLDNGTPNYQDLRAAFTKHNIPFPDIQPILFSYPDGLPAILTPEQTEDVAVTIEANGVEPQPNTALLWYFVDGTGLTSASLTHNGGDSYTATLPAVDCTSVVDYFFQVTGDDGNVYVDPVSGLYSVQALDDLEVVFVDNFDTDKGWTAGVPDDDAVRGQWTRMPPEQTQNGSGQIAQPGQVIDGTNCWVTDGRAGNGLGDYDVDNGKTTLLSPVFDLSDNTDPIVSYWRWYSNHTGANPYNDIFVVDVSNDGGSTWTNFETVGPDGPEVEGDWYFVERRIADVVAPTSAVRFRFVASDYDPQALVEAAIDLFSISDAVCDDGCIADFNGDGVVDTQDVLAFLNAWVAGDDSADVNGDGEVNTQDVLEFLNLWNAGC